jgi:hypothetical protein
VDAERTHELACRAGATVMGSSDDLADLHYILSGVELVKFLTLAGAPPCPVPLPVQNAKAV